MPDHCPERPSHEKTGAAGTPSQQRRSYVVRPSFQRKMVTQLSLIILVTSAYVVLILLGSRYYALWADHRLHEFSLTDHFLSSFTEVLGFWLICYVLLFAYFALKFSNSIAGPLHRYRKLLETFPHGGMLRLRSSDDIEFHDIANLLNDRLGWVREHLVELDGLCQEIEDLASRTAGEEQRLHLVGIAERLRSSADRAEGRAGPEAGKELARGSAEG